MTVRLLEADSFTQAVDQGVPDFQGRGVICYGHQISVHGTVSAQPGTSAIGFRDESTGFFTALGFNYQFPNFEAAGSGADINQGFYATLEAIYGIYLNKIDLALYGCGVLGIDGTGNSSINLEAIMLLSGVTMNSQIGYIQTSDTGVKAITGLGFAPQLVLFTYYGHANLGDPIVGFGAKSTMSLGAFDGTDQWCVATSSGGYITGASGRGVKQSQSFVAMDTHGDDPAVAAVSLDADGFTIDLGAGNNNVIGWYALGDVNGDFKVGMGVEGDTDITPGFQAESVLFANCGCTALDSQQSGGSVGFGGVAANDVGLDQYAGFGAGGAVKNNRAYWNTTAIAMSLHSGGGTPALDAEASVTAINATTVDLDWTTTSGTGMMFGWVAISLSDAQGFGGCGFLGQIYRWLKR